MAREAHWLTSSGTRDRVDRVFTLWKWKPEKNTWETCPLWYRMVPPPPPFTPNPYWLLITFVWLRWVGSFKVVRSVRFIRVRWISSSWLAWVDWFVWSQSLGLDCYTAACLGKLARLSVQSTYFVSSFFWATQPEGEAIFHRMIGEKHEKLAIFQVSRAKTVIHRGWLVGGFERAKR